jgi:hypothetical protein
MGSISLLRYLPSPAAAERYFASCVGYAPVCVPLNPLYDAQRTRRETLLAIMTTLRTQHSKWVNDVAMPFAHVLGPQLPRANPNPFVPRLSHLGVFDDVLVEGKEGERIEMHDVKCQLRVGKATSTYVDIVLQECWQLWELTVDADYALCGPTKASCIGVCRCVYALLILTDSQCLMTGLGYLRRRLSERIS